MAGKIMMLALGALACATIALIGWGPTGVACRELPGSWPGPTVNSKLQAVLYSMSKVNDKDMAFLERIFRSYTKRDYYEMQSFTTDLDMAFQNEEEKQALMGKAKEVCGTVRANYLFGYENVGSTLPSMSMDGVPLDKWFKLAHACNMLMFLTPEDEAAANAEIRDLLSSKNGGKWVGSNNLRQMNAIEEDIGVPFTQLSDKGALSALLNCSDEDKKFLEKFDAKLFEQYTDLMDIVHVKLFFRQMLNNIHDRDQEKKIYETNCARFLDIYNSGKRGQMAAAGSEASKEASRADLDKMNKYFLVCATLFPTKQNSTATKGLKREPVGVSSARIV